MNPDPSKRPNVVNNSWGGGGGDFWYGGVVGAWRAAGIFPQFSAGNNGPNCSTTGSPGDYGLSFGAAAIAENLSIAGFSSRGPAAVTGMLKPNVSAPGVAVRSSLPGDTYGNLGGTSMASPHVAGTVALIWSAQPRWLARLRIPCGCCRRRRRRCTRWMAAVATPAPRIKPYVWLGAGECGCGGG